MAEYVNTHTGPIDLDDGRILAPGEYADLDEAAEHNQHHITHGRLLPRETKKKER